MVYYRALARHSNPPPHFRIRYNEVSTGAVSAPIRRCDTPEAFLILIKCPYSLQQNSTVPT